MHRRTRAMKETNELSVVEFEQMEYVFEFTRVI